jgi:hypothetical protein
VTHGTITPERCPPEIATLARAVGRTLGLAYRLVDTHGVKIGWVSPADVTRRAYLRGLMHSAKGIDRLIEERERELEHESFMRVRASVSP